MVRSRVLSFMSDWKNKDSSKSSGPSSPVGHAAPERNAPRQTASTQPQAQPKTPPPAQQQFTGMSSATRESPVGRQRASSRPVSMVSTYQPPLMEVTQDTLPELQPIFTFLNSHANKLYQEGYFLKLDDQNSQGKPNADRTWTECFAQLVGTVLSLWDAAELDAAGQDGEVLPKFINLTDASIKMIEALPTRNNNDQPLQNVLSISTAGKNRYLLHFNSHHSLVQWTAGIRLAMFEYATLQEAYTGALIAGKGRELNNINTIMQRSRFPTEDWVRVRFGAGTPWRRCWCVISPPDEKEYNKLQKELNKKKSAYDRSRPPVLRGDVKFYDTKKTKKVKPIATLSDAFCAYAIYPQSKPLIDQSTLIKVEGLITIHSNPPTTTEGFVFVMPEAHAAVSGFEIMLRWFFPAMDTFALYGRPGRLIAETTNPQSLMFAMPTERRYGYLEILDVTGLIVEDGSSNWTEKKWRSKMKDLTAKRMTAIANGTRAGSRYSTSSRTKTRNSLTAGIGRRGGSTDDVSVKSTPSIRWGSTPATDSPFNQASRTETAPAVVTPSKPTAVFHNRSVSEAQGLDRYAGNGLDGQYEGAPTPPQHGFSAANAGHSKFQSQMSSTPERLSFEEDDRRQAGSPVQELQDLQQPTSVQPVAAPPKFSHPAGTLPPTQPFQSPELRRAKSRMSEATLAQMTGGPIYSSTDLPVRSSQDMPRHSEDRDQRGVPISMNRDARGMNANLNATSEGLVTRTDRLSFERPRSSGLNSEHLSTQPQFSTPLVPPHRNPPSYENRALPSQVMSAYTTSSDVAKPQRISNRESIIRKPLPGRPQEAVTASTLSSPNIIDKTGFDQIQPMGSTPSNDSARLMSMESNYTDGASTASPDYASTTRPSIDSKKSIERPRAGVMRTVGSEAPPVAPSSDVPHFDFGPTINYAHEKPRNSSPQPPRSAGRDMPPPPQLYQSRQPRTQSRTPEPHVRTQSSSNLNPASQTHSRNSSHNGPSPERRQMAWQPGMAGNVLPPPVGITPEQFVQQRAAGPGNQYAHHRTSSSQALRAQTPTPPLAARSEFIQSHSRNNSTPSPGARPSSRTHSRDPSALGVLGSGDLSTRLSAKEQEHVARITGQPLINNVKNPQVTQGSQPGLVGAIDAMGNQKKQMKAGLNSQAIERDIAQRQQQQYMQQQAYAMQAAQQAYIPQGAPQHMYTQQFPQQGRGYAQNMPFQAQQAYSQGGGWTTPGAQNQGLVTPEAMGRLTPSGTTQQQQYFSQQGQQQQQPQQGFRG